MTPRLKRYLRRAALALAGLAAVLLALSILSNTTWVKGRLLRLADGKLRQSLGLTLRAGQAKLRLLRLAIDLRDVEIEPLKRAPGFFRLFSADSVRVDLSWRAVLSKEVKVDSVRIVRPRLEMEASAGPSPGGPSASAGRSPPGRSPVSFEVGRFELLNGTATFKGRLWKLQASLADIGLEMSLLPPGNDHLGTFRVGQGRIEFSGASLVINSVEAGFRINGERLRLDRLALRTPASSLEVLGEVRDLQGVPEFRADFSASLDLEEAAPFIPSLSPARGKMTFKGSAEGRGSETGFKAYAESSGLAIRDFPSISFRAEIDGDRRLLNVRELTLEALGGLLQGKAEIRPSGGGRSSADLSWRNVDLGRLSGVLSSSSSIPFVPAAISDGDVKAGWDEFQLRSLEASGRAVLRPATAAGRTGEKPVLPIEGEAEFHLSSQGIEIVRTSLESGGVQLSPSGRLGWDKSIEARVKASISDLAESAGLISRLAAGRFKSPAPGPFLPERGRLDLDVRIGGNLPSLAGRGELRGEGISFGGISAGTILTAFAFGGRALDLTQFRAEVAGGLIEADGRLPWTRMGRPAGMEGRLSVRLSGLSLEAFSAFLPEKFRAGMAGRIAAVVDVTGLPDKPQAAFQASASPLLVKGIPIKALEAAGHWDGSGTLTVESLSLTTDQGVVQGSFSLDAGRREFSISAKTSGLDLALFRPLVPGEGFLTGKIGFDLQGGGDFRKPAFSLNLEAENIALPQLNVPSLHLQAESDGEQARASLSADAYGIRLEARLPLASPYVISGTIKTEKFPLQKVMGATPGRIPDGEDLAVEGTFSIPLQRPDELSARIAFKNLGLGALAALGKGKAPAGFGGSAGGWVSLTGNPGDLSRLRAEGVIDSLSVSLDRLTAENPAPVRFRLEGGALSLEDFSLRSGTSEIKASGRVQSLLSSNAALDAKLLLDLDAGLLPPELIGAVSGGRVGLDLSVSGPLSQPKILGQGSLSSGFLQLKDIPLRMSDVEVKLKFQEGGTILAEGRGMANGGLFRLSGEAAYGSGFRLGRATLSADINDFSLNFPRGLWTQSGGTVKLEGDGRTWLLSGNVKVQRGSFREDVYPGAELLGFSNLPLIPASLEIPPFYYKMALDIGVLTVEPLEVRNNMANVSLEVNLQVGGRLAAPRLSGRIQNASVGEVVFGEHRYTLERARVEFLGAATVDPNIDIVAHTQISHGAEDLDVRLQLSGKASRLEYDLTSFPPRSREELSLLILTGRSLEEIRGSGLNTVGSQMVLYFASPLASPVTQGLKKLLRAQDVTVEPLNIASEEDPGARLTFVKKVTGRSAVTYSLDISRSQRQTWLLDYGLGRNFTVRGYRKDDSSYGASFKHTFSLGAQPISFQNPADKTARAAEVLGTVSVEGDPVLPVSLLGKEWKGLIRGKAFKAVELGRATDGLWRLYRTRGFANADITPLLRRDDDGLVHVVFRIQPGQPVRFDFRGEGLSGRLKKAVLEAWTGKLPEETNLAEAQATILEELKRKRYYAAEVAADKSSLEGKTAYVFTVKKGGRYRIRKFEIVGRTTVPVREIKRSAGSYPMARSKGLWNLVNESRLSLRSIRKAFEDRGFGKASIGAPKIVEDRAGRRLDIFLDVEEGPRILVRTVSFQGNVLLGEEKLRKSLALTEGKPFSSSRLLEDKTGLLNLCQGQGLKDAEVEVQVRPEAEGPDVSLLYTIREGGRQTISSVEVAAAGRAEKSFIVRTAGLKPGQVLTLEGLAQGQKRLYDTGVFTSVNVTSVPETDRESMEKVMVEVRKAPWLSATYGLRYNSEDKVEGFGEIGLRNLLGGGRSGLLAYRQNARLKDLRISIISPYIFGARLNTLASFYYHREALDFFTTDETGFSFQQQVNLPLAFSLSWLYRLNKIHTFEPEPLGPFPFDFSLFLSEVSTNLVRDKRDDRLDPKSGSFFSLALTYSPEFLGTELPYASAYSQFSFYHSFGSALVWASGLRVGLADAYDQVLIPSRRFFAGGGYSLRGFHQDLAGPIDPYLGTPEGGEAVLIFNQELRFPVLKTLSGALFYDAGNVFPTARDLRVSDLRHCLGFGLRLVSPLGLIRADWGFNLSRRPDEPRSVLFLSVGQAF